MTATLRVDTGYRPRRLQAEIHRSLKRFSVLVCHRRFGKTVLAINEIVDQALRLDLNRPRYAYICPYQRQAKRNAWAYLQDYTQALPDRRVSTQDLAVEFMGRRVEIVGGDNPDALRGPYWDGAVFDEYGQMRPRVWSEIVRPSLADREGWALFIGTPKGKNAFADLYTDALNDPRWYAALYKASQTGVIPGAELADLRADMTPEEYDQEFECSFTAAIVGAYYGRLMAQADEAGRITSVPYDPNALVHTAWDLGIGDDTAIWFFQQVGKEVHWIDYYQAAGQSLGHYAKVIREKDYVYGEHLLPHDAEARELGTGLTRIETLKKLGLKGTVVPIHQVDDGINAARQVIPRSWFDATACAQGIETLRNYRREWVEKTGTFRPQPLHDWASHGADAYRTAAMGMPRLRIREIRTETESSFGSYDPHRWRSNDPKRPAASYHPHKW